MQLEQSGFRIYNAVLSRIPSLCFILAAAICLALMAINSFLVSESHLEGSFQKCWQRYYDTLHANNSEFVKEMVIRNKGNVSERELENAYRLVNSTSVVRIEMSESLAEG